MAKSTHVLSAVDKCHQRAKKCLKEAGNDPFRQQQCIIEYLGCVLQQAQLLADQQSELGIGAGSDVPVASAKGRRIAPAGRQ